MQERAARKLEEILFGRNRNEIRWEAL